MKSSGMKAVGNFFQTLGKALQLPVAVLPVAGILLRIGQPDLLGHFGKWGAFIAAAGGGIFGQLPLLFGMGVAVGFAKTKDGAAAVAAAVGYFVITEGMKAIDPTINMGVLSGIIMGCIAGILFNRFSKIKTPQFLAFFGGRRFVPIITGLAGIVAAAFFGFIWPYVQKGINAGGDWMINSGYIGRFFYGFFNRLLIPTGLHQVLNTLVWFQLGSFTDAAGQVVTGDLARYFAGDVTAGTFMVGFFPIMMFGLPGACLAMFLAARKENRKAVGGILFSAGLTALITGITEPVEFSFMFVAMPLYLVHSVLTGIAHIIMNLLHIRLGFTFSAGLFDYILNFKYGMGPEHSWRGLWTIPIGVGFFVVYWALFTVAIRVFNIKTPGREEGEMFAEEGVEESSSGKPGNFALYDERAVHMIAGLGGADNIIDLDGCTTRLRVEVKSNDAIVESELKLGGSRGFMNKAKGSIQVVYGTDVDYLVDAIKKIMGR